MKKYKIVVNYDSGDSFNTYPNQETECIEEWDDLEVAKENLIRIQEHYKAYQKIKGWSSYGRGEWKDWSNKEWYSKDYPEYSLLLKKDDRTNYRESCAWVGYFESMNYAEIRLKKDEMRVYAN